MLTRVLAFLLFVFLTVNSFSQSDVAAGLQRDIDRYQLENVEEKLFVHTDKTAYTAGDILWFKVYSVNGTTRKPLTISKVSYVEVLDRDDKPVLQAKVKMQNGSGSGSFQLPFSLASDAYVLKAYTSWMKNFSPSDYFETPITIINTLKRAETIERSDSEVYDIQFFPEGGNLVNGLPSTIAFKGVNRWGKSIDFAGYVLDDKNDTLSRFRPLKKGMGTFLFTPSSNKKYRAVINVDGRVLTKVFQSVYSEGYIMTVKPSNENRLLVSIASNLSSANPFVYLVVQSGQAMNTVEAKQLVNGKAEFMIDRTKLSEGVSRFTLFNNQQQPLCERLYCKPPKQQLQIALSTDASVYAKRKKAGIQISVPKDSGLANQTDLSLSVYRLDGMQTSAQPDIFNYLWLSSDIRGVVESPDDYLVDTSSEGLQALDNLMLTQGWRRFRWEDVLQNKKIAPRFLPEYEGQIITGKITDKATGLPMQGVTAYLSVPAPVFQFSTAVSHDSGRIAFSANRFFGAGEMIVQTADTTGNLYRVTLDNPFSQTTSYTQLPPLQLSKTWRNELLQNSIAVQTQNAYLSDERQHFMVYEEGDTSVFYGKPDKRYLLDNYTRFPTMEEVMREYVTEVRVSKTSSNYQYTVDNLPYREFFKDKPLVLLDGIPVWNTNQMITYDPLQIKALDIVTHKYYLGSQTYNGIVSYFTYKGDASGFDANPAALHIDEEGLQLQREFYSPQYETQQQANSRLPDFRNTLLWAPHIRTGSDGKQTLSFYTSDLPGEYEIVVQGITSGGLAGSRRIHISVQK